MDNDIEARSYNTGMCAPEAFFLNRRYIFENERFDPDSKDFVQASLKRGFLQFYRTSNQRWSPMRHGVLYTPKSLWGDDDSSSTTKKTAAASAADAASSLTSMVPVVGSLSKDLPKTDDDSKPPITYTTIEVKFTEDPGMTPIIAENFVDTKTLKRPSCTVNTITDTTVITVEPVAAAEVVTLFGLPIKPEFVSWFAGSTVSTVNMMLDIAQNAYGVELNQRNRVVRIEGFQMEQMSKFRERALTRWGLPSILVDHVTYFDDQRQRDKLARRSPYEILLDILFGMLNVDYSITTNIYDDTEGNLSLRVHYKDDSTNYFKWVRTSHTPMLLKLFESALTAPHEEVHRKKALPRKDGRLISLVQFTVNLLG